ncbi:MAG: protein kinase domain-containing protein [Verrucomicrobiales bacterium]
MADLNIYLNAPDGRDPEELAAYLAEACGGDTGLRARVEALFAAGREAGEDFLATQLGAEDEDLPPTDSEREREGSVIGKYKLLQSIGEGGFGVVYMAEQQKPVKRRVALKIIKAGMDTREVIARFEAERQALAMMDHPNIAKVHDAGATETGRPYFVMELVKGAPITDFCDEQGLNTEERLDLFMDVCRAVQHAHQKGIIHRDLKPSNVMVTLHDDKAVVKVIDFGVAKATQGDLTDKTLFTRLDQFIGTPAYMSPEQAQASGLDIDTRSDIYTLGVLLYELLTGQTPFNPKEMLTAGYDEIRRVIREQEPPKPSTRVSTLGDAELTSLAKRRKSEPQRLRALLRGDLDWIVMKALEKDRSLRYSTVAGLGEDVDRYLTNQTVLAGPPSVIYRVRKFVRRNRGGVAATLALLLALLIGLALSYSQADRALKAEHALSDKVDELQQTKDLLRVALAFGVDEIADQDPLDDASLKFPVGFQEVALEDGNERMYLAKAGDEPILLRQDQPDGPAAPFRQATITKIVNEVIVVDAAGEQRPAKVGMVVNGIVSVKTGRRSRAELQYGEDTITRIGSNSVFTFKAGMDAIKLEKGTILLESKNGRKVRTAAITASISG